jgi:hypothetical protein
LTWLTQGFLPNNSNLALSDLERVELPPVVDLEREIKINRFELREYHSKTDFYLLFSF